MKMPVRLFSDQRGVTAVEFAILAPVMLTMICGAIELGHLAFARVALEGAVTEAARIATASLESSEDSRIVALEESINKTMSQFRTAPDQSLRIETQVFHDFSTAYPEPFTDANNNKAYDVGEPYTDRNQNGKWDPAIQIAGKKLGGPGDVIAVTAVFPKRILFGFLRADWALGSAMELRASTVVRNEAVVRKS